MNIHKKIACMFLVCCLILGSGCSKRGTDVKVKQHLEMAVKYLSENRFEEAILVYREVIKIDPKNIASYKGINIAYSMLGKFDDAESALQEGLNRVSDKKSLKLAMAGLLVDRGKEEQAEEIYKELIALDKNYIAAYQAYAKMLRGKGRINQAINLLEIALAESRDTNKLSLLLSGMYIESGNKDKAMQVISQSLAKDSGQSSVYKMVEHAYKGRWEELVMLGDQYIKQSHLMQGYIFKLTGHFNQGNYDDLVKLYSSAPEDVKSSIKVKIILAQAYLKSGKQEQATDLMKNINFENIKDAGMLADLAGYYLEAGDKDTSRKLASRGINIDEEVQENYLVLYRSYLGQDESLANIWRIKYILSSPLGPSAAEKELIERLKNMVEKVETKPISQKSQETEQDKEIANNIVEDVLLEKEDIRGNLTWRNYAYLCTKENIAYQCYAFGFDIENKFDLSKEKIPFNTKDGIVYWSVTEKYFKKLTVFKIYNPKIYRTEFVRTQAQPGDPCYNDLSSYDEWISVGLIYRGESGPVPNYVPITRGELSFEKCLQLSGKKSDSIIFVEIR